MKLGDKPHWSELAVIPIMLIGVLFFARPSFLFGSDKNSSNALGVIIAVAGSFGGACAHNIVRKLGKGVHFRTGFLITKLKIISQIFFLSG